MSIEIFDDDIEQLRDDLSVEPWNVISNDDVRNSCLLPIRISYEFVDMGDTEYGFNQNFSEKYYPTVWRFFRKPKARPFISKARCHTFAPAR